MATADAALCVLSLSDVLKEDGALHVPEFVKDLLTPSTYVLLNKSDLLSDTSPGPSGSQAIQTQIQNVMHTLTGACAGTWAVSLSTGGGLEVFEREFTRLLHQRYVTH